MARQINYGYKPCRVCKNEFKPNSGRHFYCSERCRRGEGICVVCKTKFIKKGNTTGIYCSPQCWYKSGDAKVIQPKYCIRCNKEFYPHNEVQKYCSRACADLGRRKPRIENCLACGEYIPYTPLKKQNKYCSRSCAMSQVVRRNMSQNLPIGTTRISPIGYVVVKVEKGKDGWKQEHRVIMESLLSRTLEPHERVHHKNGKRADNRPENLELWSLKKKDPPGIRVGDYHCTGCRCFENSN